MNIIKTIIDFDLSLKQNIPEMIYSDFNIFSRIKDSGNYFILNLLTGNADILSPEEAEKVQAIKSDSSREYDEFTREFAAKGYLMDSDEEAKLYRRRYLDFLDSRETDEIQLFLVTNYSCNFACSYCYQDEYNNTDKELSPEIIDSFFAYIRNNFTGRRKYITVFGGEPLMSSPKQKRHIEQIIDRSNESGLELCFVTNGYTLEEYVPLLKKGHIREIQVTLDGTAGIHDKRRFLKGGGPTFSRIVRGIDTCLENRIPVNLRMVIDKENISELPALATFAIEKGWTANELFKTQIGRNYELHHCQKESDRLFSRISLYEDIYRLVDENPHILDFYKPAYSVSRFLFENGELPDPLFDSCPACKTEWAFDYSGSIYPCTATVGKKDEALGSFYPVVSLNNELVEKWSGRDVTSIDKCRSCNLRLACGGGCGSVAKNNTGSICSADCRPVKELLELGFSAYFEK